MKGKCNNNNHDSGSSERKKCMNETFMHLAGSYNPKIRLFFLRAGGTLTKHLSHFTFCKTKPNPISQLSFAAHGRAVNIFIKYFLFFVKQEFINNFFVVCVWAHSNLFFHSFLLVRRNPFQRTRVWCSWIIQWKWAAFAQVSWIPPMPSARVYIIIDFN